MSYKLENRYGFVDHVAARRYFVSDESRELYGNPGVHLVTDTVQLMPRSSTALEGRVQTFVLATREKRGCSAVGEVALMFLTCGLYLCCCSNEPCGPSTRLSAKKITREEAIALASGSRYLFHPATLECLGLNPADGLTEKERDRLLVKAKQDAKIDRQAAIGRGYGASTGGK